MKSSENQLEYGGIADAHGIESFVPFAKISMAHELRAVSNRQRHAVVYKVVIDPDTVEAVEELLESQEYEYALTYLKENALEVGIEKGFDRSWGMIPNPELDPYYKQGV